MKKIKIIDVINASHTLKRLMNVRFTNFNVMHSLVNLSKFIDKELVFYSSEVEKLKTVYNIDAEGKSTPENIKGFNTEYNNLINTEIDYPDELDFTISENDFLSKEDYLLPIEILILDKFVDIG